MMNNNDIMVTVFCLAYNHEKYIRQCLDGFVKQKTSFKYEVIVHEDASTDSTADIIREYESKYPNIIKPIYQKENQYNKGFYYTEEFCLKNAKGKYIALCEGDDFWTDDQKLQKQVDAMEKNPSCKMCLCKVRAVQENGERMEQTYPNFEMNTGVYHTEELLKIICKEYSFQTSSYFFEKEKLKEYFDEKPSFFRVAPVGDWPYLLYFSQFDIYYIDDEMSCYRKNAIGNFSTTMSSSSVEAQKKYYMSMIAMIEAFDQYTQYQYHDSCNHFDRFYRYYYTLLIQEQNYTEIFGNKIYRKMLNEERRSDRLAIKCDYYCPWALKIMKKIKNNEK